jgi:hypothetical protein
MEANQHPQRSPRRFSENTVHFIPCDAQETGGGGHVPAGLVKRQAEESAAQLFDETGIAHVVERSRMNPGLERLVRS